MVNSIDVLHVVGGMDIGGIENMLMTILPYMNDEKIKFSFAVHGDKIGVHEKKIKELGGNVYHLPKFYGINIIFYIRAWMNLLKEHGEFKIVHGHMTPTASIYLLLAKKYGRITIAHSHNSDRRSGNFLHRSIKFIMEYPLRYISDYFMGCSSAAAKFLFGNKILQNSRYMLWRNAIETDKFIFNNDKREKYREKLRLHDEILIGHSGRLTYQKNQIFLLRVFSAFHKIKPNSKLLLLGEGNLHEKISNYIRDLDLQDSVIMLGAVNNPSDYLSAMDIFCLPSRWEAFGVSLLEAQVNGLPCLASDCVQKECMISDGLELCSLKHDPQVWAERLLGLNRKKVNHISGNPYDVKSVAREVSDFYRKIITEK